MWKKLMKDKMAVICIVLLLIITLAGIFAPVISSYDPTEGDIIKKFAKIMFLKTKNYHVADYNFYYLIPLMSCSENQQYLKCFHYFH